MAANRITGDNDDNRLGGFSTSFSGTFDGMGGTDTLWVKSPGTPVVVDMNKGTITGGHYDGSTITGIENVENKSPNSAIKIFGDDADNVLKGGNKDDVLTGGKGTNVLKAGSGNDRLGGDSKGQTTEFDGGKGTDTLWVKSPGDKVTVNLVKGTIEGGHYDGSTITGVEKLENKSPNSAVEFIGDRADNVLIGGNKDDLLKGGNGADVLKGGSGNDRLRGDNGADELFGGKGDDIFVARNGDALFDGGEGGETAGDMLMAGAGDVDLSLGTYVRGNTVAVVKDIENVRGAGAAQTFVGDDGDNLLSTLGGDDTLEGGDGNDRLKGGSGADDFVFRNTDVNGDRLTGDDTITDFAEGDRILTSVKLDDGGDGIVTLGNNGVLDLYGEGNAGGTVAFANGVDELEFIGTEGGFFVYEIA